MEPLTLELGKRREMFWDDYLVDPERTTATSRVMQPILRESAFWLDHPVEAGSISYPCIVKDDHGYRMYYVAWARDDGKRVSNICVLESEDGLTWTRPNLRLHSFGGSLDNNIVIPSTDFRDNAFIFYDTNPNCPPEERYKCLADGIPASSEAELNDPNAMKRGLWYYYSADGYTFHRWGLVSVCGFFDTQNTAHWDGSRYVAYIRNYHGFSMENASGSITSDGVTDINDHKIPGADKNRGIRDVRVMYSDDFRHWSTPELIRFRDGKDVSLYTNVISRYSRAPHMLVGFPTRYCERPGWSANFDQLADPERRKYLMQVSEPRSGLAVTDCIFMWSRDGLNWNRFSEAFMTPGYEATHNWVYGDCYPAYGFVDGGNETLFMYTIDYHRSAGVPKPLNRYEIRKDGFACYMAGGDEAVLVTKPLSFDGSVLHLNFSSSAYGYVYVDVLDPDGNVISPNSFEIFGDTLDRAVIFEDGSDFAPFAGRPVRLRFTMRDAKLYSMKFE